MARGGSRIARIKAALEDYHVEALCKTWLPNGRLKGRAWVCRSPFRDEKTPSFYVYLAPSPGYYDYGSGQHGDIIDLCCKMFGVQIGEALEAFEQMLGIDSVKNTIPIDGGTSATGASQGRG